MRAIKTRAILQSFRQKRRETAKDVEALRSTQKEVWESHDSQKQLTHFCKTDRYIFKFRPLKLNCLQMEWELTLHGVRSFLGAELYFNWSLRNHKSVLQKSWAEIFTRIGGQVESLRCIPAENGSKPQATLTDRIFHLRVTEGTARINHSPTPSSTRLSSLLHSSSPQKKKVAWLAWGARRQLMTNAFSVDSDGGVGERSGKIEIEISTP